MLVALFLLTFFSSSLFSQSITSSPYSRYGIGEVQERSLAHQMGMGNLGYALTNDTLPYFVHLNLLNPASYSGLRLTTFDAAVRSNTFNIQSQGSSVLQNNTSLGYAVLGFPLGKRHRGGASFGLLPYSSVGYNISDSDTNDFDVAEKFSYAGSGGLNQFYIGAATRLWPSSLERKKMDLSVGANGSYIFGTLNNERRVIYTDANYFNTLITESTTIGDFTADLGLQFSYVKDSANDYHYDSLHNRIQPFKKDIEDLKFTFGLTAGLPSALSAERDYMARTYESNTLGLSVIRDTIVNDQGVRGTVTLPLSFGAGFAVKKGERLLVSLDYSMQQWSKLTSFEENMKLNNSMRVSLGVQYIPEKRVDKKIGEFFQHVQYRGGLQYKQTYIELRNTQLNEYSISLGLGLPLKYASMVNIGVELGQRGTVANSLLQEQFVRGLIGFTLNDRWFGRRKYD